MVQNTQAEISIFIIHFQHIKNRKGIVRRQCLFYYFFSSKTTVSTCGV